MVRVSTTPLAPFVIQIHLFRSVNVCIREKIFLGEISTKLPTDIQRTARRKLLYLDEAENLQDIRAVPSNRLEKLKGGCAGQYSIRINDPWRICFEWVGNKAKNVEIVDYHG